MSGTSGTSHNSNSRSDQPRIEILTDTADLLYNTAPRGFGTFHGENRRQEIFEDFGESTTDHGFRGGSGMGSTFHRPFSDTHFGEKPCYEDTVIMLHHGKQGVRFFVQANLKTFVIMFLIFFALMNSPNIGEVISTLVRSVLGAH